MSDIRIQISDTILVSKPLLGNLFSITSTVYSSEVQKSRPFNWLKAIEMVEKPFTIKVITI
jgi:hypothetical protein